MKEQNEKWKRDRNKVIENTNSNNGNIVEEVVLENKTVNNDYNDAIVVGTENSNYDDGKLSTNENINNEATVNNVSENYGNTNNNGGSLNAKQAPVDKASNKVNHDDVNQVFEKAASKNDTVNCGSENESVKSVDVSYGVLLS